MLPNSEHGIGCSIRLHLGGWPPRPVPTMSHLRQMPKHFTPNSYHYFPLFFTFWPNFPTFQWLCLIPLEALLQACLRSRLHPTAQDHYHKSTSDQAQYELPQVSIPLSHVYQARPSLMSISHYHMTYIRPPSWLSSRIKLLLPTREVFSMRHWINTPIKHSEDVIFSNI